MSSNDYIGALLRLKHVMVEWPMMKGQCANNMCLLAESKCLLCDKPVHRMSCSKRGRASYWQTMGGQINMHSRCPDA